MRSKFGSVFGLSLLGLLMSLSLNAQNINVSGTISDLNGEPVIGAAVQVQNTTQGVVTGADGTYSISVPRNAVLEVSSLGFRTQVIPVEGRNLINVILEEDTEALEATVVIGYGTARRSNVTGSIASV